MTLAVCADVRYPGGLSSVLAGCCAQANTIGSEQRTKDFNTYDYRIRSGIVKSQPSLRSDHAYRVELV